MSANMLLCGLALLAVWQVAASEAPSLQEVISAALNHTAGMAEGPQAAAQAASQQLQSLAHLLVLSGESAFTASQGPLLAASGRLQQAVDAALGDLPRCVLGQQDAAAQLVFNAGAGVVRCVTDELAQAAALMADVAALAGQAVLLPHRAAGDIVACLQYPLTAVSCVAEVVGRWGEASLNITAALTQDASRAVHLLVAGPRDIATCAEQRVNTAVAGVNQIIVSVAKCVVDASNSTSTSTTTTARSSR